MSRFRRWFVHGMLLTVLGMLLAFPLAAHAQNYNGSIVGNVTDATGASVPGAKVNCHQYRHEQYLHGNNERSRLVLDSPIAHRHL